MSSSKPSYSQRLEVVAAYDQVIQELIDKGREAYFVTLMFKQLRGYSHSRTLQMQNCATDFHETLTRHIVRKPNSPKWKKLRPYIFGAPDLPVLKNEKRWTPLHKPNHGLHFNAIVITPPQNRFAPGRDQHPWFPRQSRLHESLDQHVERCRALFEAGRPFRVHVQPITYGTMSDYAFKNIKNGRVDYDHLLVLR